MRPRSLSPVFLRYWLARLRPLARPIFWVPTSLIGLAILFAWELSTRPDWLTALVRSPTNQTSELSPEDQAIAADIDTLPLLLNDVGLSTRGIEIEGSADGTNNPAGNAIGGVTTIPLIGSVVKEPLTANQTLLPGLGNILTGGLSQGLGLGNQSGGRTAADEAGLLTRSMTPFGDRLGNVTSVDTTSALATALSQSQSGNAVPSNQSALAAALARYNNESANRSTSSQLTPASPSVAPDNSFFRPPVEGTTGLTNNQPALSPPLEGTTGLGNAAAIPTSLYGNSFSNLTGNSPAPGTGLIPVIPTSGLVLIPAPVGAPNSFATPTLPSQTNYGSVLPTVGTTPDSSGQLVQVNPQPFSVPRRVPGRAIGGGQINTFSNP